MYQGINVLAHSGSYIEGCFLDVIRQTSVKTVAINTPLEIQSHSVDVLLLDEYLLSVYSVEEWLSQECAVLVPQSLVYSALFGKQLPSHVLILPDNASDTFIRQAVTFAAKHTQLRRASLALNSSLQAKGERLKKLVELGIALSAEAVLDQLLTRILVEGQNLVGCDAASLFLVNRSDPGNIHLTFKLARNQSLAPPFKEEVIPLTSASIAGHAAVSGEVLNIDDVYNMPAGVPYQFNHSFDRTMGYRTVSLVAIPMIDQRKQTVGVLEFINRKKDPAVTLTNPEVTRHQVIPFDRHDVSLLKALASQAAVAIENRQLLDAQRR